MIKAILLDLDSLTRWEANDDFAAAYVRLLADYLNQQWRRNDLLKVLPMAVQALAGFRDGQQTNADLIAEVICRETGSPIAQIQEGLRRFHQEAYPLLHEPPLSIPAARRLLDHLRQQNYAIAIITQPIYPTNAIQERLAGAGLPDDLDNYGLVTTNEMHFAQTDTAFYAEVIARMGIEPDEAVIVSSNLENVIVWARRLGLHTYQLNAPQTATSGTLNDFFSAVTTTNWLETLAPSPLTPEMIEPEMRGNLGALFGILASARPYCWRQHPEPDEWSPMQILCHLVASESSTHRARLERILAADNPFIVAPPPGPHDVADCGSDGLTIAREFAQERQETLDWLRQLQPADWLRPARHSIFGLTTLLEMAHFTAQHDRLHLNQLCQTIGRCT
ncbi:MAG TPA: DinB family protein [Phototrophicaceae bacterium]|nr:DinB family protein [Phototrophicaceae bacterium]